MVLVAPKGVRCGQMKTRRPFHDDGVACADLQVHVLLGLNEMLRIVTSFCSQPPLEMYY